MKKNITIIGSIAVLILLGVLILSREKNTDNVKTPQNQSELGIALKKDELVIGIDEAFPPTTFKEADGSYAGMDIDFALEVEKRTGVKVVFKPIEWDNIIPALLMKDIDVVWSGMGVTPEREQKANFVVYSKGPKGYAFTTSESQIKSKEDLKDKIIAVQAGSYQEEDLKNGKIIPVNSWKEIRSVSTLPEAILDLKLGRIDAVICSQDNAGYYIEKTLNESANFKVLDVGYEVGSVGIAIRKEDSEVKSALQKIVDEIITDGTASKISLKWLGIDKYQNF